MENEYYVLKGEDGKHYPMAFVARVDRAGEFRKEEYEQKKLEEGETIVKVKFIEI